MKAGVIGLGVGEQHVIGYQAVEGTEVSAVCDLDLEHARAVAQRHSVARATNRYQDITEDPSIDVVSICSYDTDHVPQAISALRNGKHVMIEKPIAVNRHDAEELLAVQQQSGLILTSNLILRASPRFRAVKDLVADGALGDLYYLEGDYLHGILHKLTEGWRGRVPGYSVIFGGGIHLIDLMRWIAGREVEEVSGMGGRRLVAGSAFPGHDTTVTLLGFEGGVLGKCTTTLGPRRPKFHSLAVYGTKGTFINGPDIGYLYPTDDPQDAVVVDKPYPGIAKGDLLVDFVNAVREGRQPEVTAIDVFRVMDVCFTAVEAIEARRTLPVRYSL